MLIVEDGTGVANADSYASLQTIRDYAAKRGFTLPASDSVLEQYAIRAMDYLNGLNYLGDQSFVALKWPRTHFGYYLDPEYDIDVLPIDIVKAQCQLIVEIANGIDILPTVTTTVAVKREKVGPIETEYATSSAGSNGPSMPLVASLLAPWLAGRGAMFKTVRA